MSSSRPTAASFGDKRLCGSQHPKLPHLACRQRRLLEEVQPALRAQPLILGGGTAARTDPARGRWRDRGRGRSGGAERPIVQELSCHANPREILNALQGGTISRRIRPALGVSKLQMFSAEAAARSGPLSNVPRTEERCLFRVECLAQMKDDGPPSLAWPSMGLPAVMGRKQGAFLPSLWATLDAIRLVHGTHIARPGETGPARAPASPTPRDRRLHGPPLCLPRSTSTQRADHCGRSIRSRRTPQRGPRSPYRDRSS
jgi:hypothetical protein